MTRHKPLSPEMRSLLDALRSGPQGELPGLQVGQVVRFIGGGWWQIDGAPRCWHSVTVFALLHRRLLVHVSPRTYRARTPNDVEVPQAREVAA